MNAWDALSDAERAPILAALRAIVDQRAEDDATASVYGRVYGEPRIELYDGTRDAEQLVLHYVFDFWLWCMAQSGSDWNHHHVYQATAEFANGALIGQSATRRRETYVHENDERNYDRDAVFRQVLAEVRRERR